MMWLVSDSRTGDAAHEEQSYIGWAGKTETITTDMNLGRGSTRGLPDHGLRRALWDAAYGHVNGFKLSAILYFILTRSLSSRVQRWVLQREGHTLDYNGNPIATIGSIEA